MDEAAPPEIEQQDGDFFAWLIRPSVVIGGPHEQYCMGLAGGFIDSDPAEWEFSEDEGANRTTVGRLLREIPKILAPWCRHYAGIGLLRADKIMAPPSAPQAADGFVEPAFYLIHAADEGVGAAEALGSFGEQRLPIEGSDGVELVLSPDILPTNATLLFRHAKTGDFATGQWGGEATPDAAPLPTESREDWLQRVSIPGAKLSRLAERWDRSGRNIELFNLCGAADERAAGDRSIEWVVPGLIPRGYVTLLVGTKMAGKSTLLGEMMAVVDSDAPDPRLVLGTQVTARGAGAFVSGEDGDDIYNDRSKYYEPIHGPSKSYFIDTASHPWPDALRLLHDIPELTFVGIDPLRAMLPGDEDASANISPFFDELNALARAKNCAVVLVHHLSKGTPRSLSALLNAVRGSGAITDRPRIVIGMLDRGAGVTEVGIIKQNIPPSEKLWGEVNAGRPFRKDANTLTLKSIDAGHSGTAGVAANVDHAGRVLDAVRHYNCMGAVLRRTGKSELHALGVPQLAGLSRHVLRKVVGDLLEAGLLADGEDGLQVVDKPPVAALPATLETPATVEGRS